MNKIGFLESLQRQEIERQDVEAVLDFRLPLETAWAIRALLRGWAVSLKAAELRIAMEGGNIPESYTLVRRSASIFERETERGVMKGLTKWRLAPLF